MTEYNRFWDGTTVGFAGPYDSQGFALFVQDLLGSASILNAGILTGRGNGVDAPLDVQETSPASKQIAVKPGSAMVSQLHPTKPKGVRYYYTDDDINITVPDNTDGSGFDRIDLLVLRSNSTTQVITPVLITGTPAGAPVAPTPVRAGAIYDIELAEITAQNLFVTITNSDIDTSVQTRTPVWEPINGGTGLEGGYSAGDILYASGANAFSTANLPEAHIPVGDGTGVVSIDTRPIVLWRNSGSTTVFGVSLLNTIPLTNSNDDTGYLLGLGSNQFQLAVGWYRALFGTITAATNNVSRYCIPTIYNLSTTTHLVVGMSTLNAITHHRPMLSTYEFEVTDSSHNHVFNLASNDAGTIQADVAAFGGTFPQIRASAILILQRVR